HGLMGQAIINLLCAGSRFLAVNTQTNSANTGYNLITKYPRADFICIDEPEIRLARHDRMSDLRELIEAITRKQGRRRIAITRGHLGALTYAVERGFFEVPVFSSKTGERVCAGAGSFSGAS